MQMDRPGAWRIRARRRSFRPSCCAMGSSPAWKGRCGARWNRTSCRPISPTAAGSRTRTRSSPSVKIAAIAPISGSEDDTLFADVEVTAGEITERYALPMAIAWEDEPTSPFEMPLAFARARRGRRVGLLTDGFASARMARALMKLPAKARLHSTSARADPIYPGCRQPCSKFRPRPRSNGRGPSRPTRR